MDTMGDADELDYDDELPRTAPPLFTSEALALAGLALVLVAPLCTSLFQFLSFVLGDDINSRSPAWQFFFFAAPTGLLAVLGAGLGLRASRDHGVTGWGRSVAGAAVAVGTVVAALVAIGIVAGFLFADETF